MSPSTLPPSTRRDPWLDAVRGVSVLAMVFGHTLDLTLLDHVRGLPLVGLYWSFRGLTAPLFLVVAGWALVSSLRSTQADTVGRRLRRAALVLALGYGLHWPGLAAAQGMAAEGTLWPHLLALLWQALWVAVILRVGAQLFRKTVLKSGPPVKWWRFGRA